MIPVLLSVCGRRLLTEGVRADCVCVRVFSLVVMHSEILDSSCDVAYGGVFLILACDRAEAAQPHN